MAQGWVTLAVALIALVGAPIAGLVAGRTTETAALRQSRQWQRVTAVLTRDAPHTSRPYAGPGRLVVPAPARWTGRDGKRHTGKALAKPDAPAGTRVPLWLDDRGRPHGEPAGHSDAPAQGASVGALTAIGICLLAWMFRWVFVQRLDKRRMAAWEREWAEVGPRWRRHTP